MRVAYQLPDYSVVMWVKIGEDFDALRSEILSTASQDPYETTQYQGMADFHFGFDDLTSAHELAQKFEPIAQHPDVVVLRIVSRDDSIESISLKDQRETRMKIGRNDSCPCGSGKKFKKCCLH